MSERINDKIKEIEKYLKELEEIRPDTIEAYTQDIKTKAACERYAEVVIEAIIDLAFLSIKEKKLPSPESDLQAFDILFQNKIIQPEIADRLKDAKRMRNILAHKYGEEDDSIIFNAVKDELESDANDFITSIKSMLAEKSAAKKNSKFHEKEKQNQAKNHKSQA